MEEAKGQSILDKMLTTFINTLVLSLIHILTGLYTVQNFAFQCFIGCRNHGDGFVIVCIERLFLCLYYLCLLYTSIYPKYS